ncbi:MAG: sigma-54 dependent transcriptional regulator, partial [Acidobacteria bacterium]|nr:sigma-54 dependent transcriptional regulator [Acidobacteriota bacterium]
SVQCSDNQSAGTGEEKKACRRKPAEPPAAAPNGFPLPPLGTSIAVRRLIGTLLHLAPSESTILFKGETGTGKGFLAKLLHACSPRSLRPFVEVVCGALTETLLASELFGHERGAFTGATQAKRGRFELAEDGTIFLDEIGDLSLEMQVKLLRVLQERQYERVGGTETLTTAARIVVATNRDLAALVREGSFRKDLYHRLNVVCLELPPLRERHADIPLLVQSFLKEFAEKNQRGIARMTVRAVRMLQRHSWPGNVRELRNCIERLVVLNQTGKIGVGDLPLEIQGKTTSSFLQSNAATGDQEKADLLKALHASGGDRTAASKLLGVCRAQFYRMLRRHSL